MHLAGTSVERLLEAVGDVLDEFAADPPADVYLARQLSAARDVVRFVAEHAQWSADAAIADRADAAGLLDLLRGDGPDADDGLEAALGHFVTSGRWAGDAQARGAVRAALLATANRQVGYGAAIRSLT